MKTKAEASNGDAPANNAQPALKNEAYRDLPSIGFIRLPMVLRLYPVSRSTWFAGVKAGRYPRPVRLSPGVAAYDIRSVRALIAEKQADVTR